MLVLSPQTHVLDLVLSLSGVLSCSSGKKIILSFSVLIVPCSLRETVPECYDSSPNDQTSFNNSEGDAKRELVMTS